MYFSMGGSMFCKLKNYKQKKKVRIHMKLPKDPVMLLSVVNTELRDFYPSLEEFAKAHMISESEIVDKLKMINYEYNSERNKFV